MRKRCYYEILELNLAATLSEIRHSYHKLARKWHPDKNKSLQAKACFQELNQAYAILSDPEEKHFYDRHRETIIKNWNLECGGFGYTENTQTVVSSGNILPYFVKPGFLGYGDSEGGFYNVYRDVFDTVNAGVEEMNALIYGPSDSDNQVDNEGSDRPVSSVPSFGDSETHLTDVVAFYTYWENTLACVEEDWMQLCSEDTPENRELDLVRSLVDRRKMMRKYIEIIKSLIKFVKMQDPRYKRYLENGIMLGLGYEERKNSQEKDSKMEEEEKGDSERDKNSHTKGYGKHNRVTCQECWDWAASHLKEVLQTQDEEEGDWQEGLPEPLMQGSVDEVNKGNNKESGWEFALGDQEKRDVDQEID